MGVWVAVGVTVGEEIIVGVATGINNVEVTVGDTTVTSLTGFFEQEKRVIADKAAAINQNLLVNLIP